MAYVLTTALAGLLGPALLAGWFTTAWRASGTLGEDRGARLAWSLAGALWLGLVWTRLALELHLFTPWVGWATAAASIAVGWPVLPDLQRGLGQVWAWVRARPRALQLWLAAYLAVVVAAAGRVLAYVPTGFDLIGYHLVHAGRWVREGSIVRESAPGLWSYYEFFPVGSDAPYAWLMLADGTTHSLLWLPLVVSGLLPLVLALAGRELGLDDDTSLLTSLVVLSVPANLAWVHVLTPDTVVLLVGVLVLLLALRGLRTGALVDLVGLGLAIAALADLKPWGLALGLLPVTALILHRRHLLRDLVALGAPMVLLVPGLVRRAAEAGDPLYPGGLPLDLAHANPVMLALTEVVVADWVGFGAWRGYLFPGLVFWVPTYMGFAPVGLVVALLLPVMAWVVLRHEPRRALVLALTALPLVLLLAEPAGRGLLLGWPNINGRLFLLAWAVIVLTVGLGLTRHPSALVRRLLAISGVVALATSALHVLAPDGRMLLATLVVAGIAAGALAATRLRPGSWRGALLASALGLGLAGGALRGPGPRLLMTSLAGLDADDPSPRSLGEMLAMVPYINTIGNAQAPLIAPLWDAPPSVLTVYEPDGEVRLRFFKGLLRGHHSQHSITWVSPYVHEPSPGPEAAVVGPPLAPRATWEERLLRDGVDYIVVPTGAGHPVEPMAAESGILSLVAEVEGGRLYRVDPAGTGTLSPTPRPESP